jgi:flagella basal body P-ring formation protein FlgA
MVQRIVFSMIMVLFCPGFVLGLEVHFKQEALVKGSMLTLGDVAEVRGGRDTAVMEDIVLFPSPGTGKKRCYQRQTLKAYICEGLAESESIAWSGAATICILREGSRLIEPETVQAWINKALQEAAGHLEAEQIAFELRTPPKPISLPQGKLSREIVFSDPDILDSRQVSVIIRVNDRVLENLTLAGQIQACVPVVVTAQKLQRGTVLRRNHLLLKERNLAELEDPYVDINAALGKHVKRTVSMNQVLDRHDLANPVVIKRRQLVTMVLKKGPLQIQAKGLAVTEGRIGDQVMIRNMRSKQEVPCTVIGPGLTKVEF